MGRHVALLAILVAFVSAGSVRAHHSLAPYDITHAVRVKGTIVAFHRINPHSLIILEEKSADGSMRRWAVEGPSALQLDRKGFSKDGLRPGDVIEVCGYLPKEATTRQFASSAPGAVSLSGQLINGESMVMPDSHEQSWGDYGVHKCFASGYQDQHSK